MTSLNDWLLLVLTLPTDNTTARMRFWRALKAKGCAMLRDGVYLLPAMEAAENDLLELGTSIGEAGGAAHCDDVMGPNAHVAAVDPATHRVYIPLKNLNGHSALRIFEATP